MSEDQAMREVTQMFGSHLPALQSSSVPSSTAELDNVHAGTQDGQPQESTHPRRELGQQPLELAEDGMERPTPLSTGLGGRAEGNSGTVDETRATPRGHRGSKSSRQWIPTLHGYFRRSGDASEALSNRNGMEKEEN